MRIWSLEMKLYGPFTRWGYTFRMEAASALQEKETTREVLVVRPACLPCSQGESTTHPSYPIRLHNKLKLAFRFAHDGYRHKDPYYQNTCQFSSTPAVSPDILHAQQTPAEAGSSRRRRRGAYTRHKAPSQAHRTHVMMSGWETRNP